MTLKREKGFTLIEILLVVVIMGIMLAVIVPRAWRANIDAKYGQIRQHGSELANYAQQWAETELRSQDDTGPTAQLSSYYAYLCHDPALTTSSTTEWTWIANHTINDGWLTVAQTMTGRMVDGATDQSPAKPAVNFVPIDKVPRNPFNGLDVFSVQNDPATQLMPIPGAIANAFYAETKMAQGGGAGRYFYFAFTFQGTENNGTGPSDMQGDMRADTLDGIRNGQFMARAYYMGS